MIAEAPVKRGPGRPRKDPLPPGSIRKRGPGRPRKDRSAVPAQLVAELIRGGKVRTGLADGKYHPGGTDEVVFFLALLGADRIRMAEFFRVPEDQIADWEAKYPSFAQAILDGSVNADSAVVKGLLARASGLTLKSITATEFFNKEGEQTGRQVSTTHTEVAPDTKAAELWLKARHPENWVVLTGEDLRTGGSRGGGSAPPVAVTFEVVPEDRTDYRAGAR